MGTYKRVYLIAVLVLVILLIAVPGCNTTGKETTIPQNIKNINAAEADTLIKANADNPDFIIIDVRTPDEYNQGHIEKALLIDYRAESFEQEISKLDRTKKYLIYCRTGNRSAGARDMMIDLGFLDINHMESGITEWTALGYPVVK